MFKSINLVFLTYCNIRTIYMCVCVCVCVSGNMKVINNELHGLYCLCTVTNNECGMLHVNINF